MRGRVNCYIGFAFVGAFSLLVAVVLVHAFNSLPAGIAPQGF